MKRFPLPKIPITPEIKTRQLKLRKFLRDNGVTHKEIKPHGFSISIDTIPKDKIEEFLSIANSGR